MFIDNITNASRHTLELVRWSAVHTMEQFMADKGHTVLITGCLVGDQIAIWDGKQLSIWRSNQPALLVNAVGDKIGLVDPDGAWARRGAVALRRRRFVVGVGVGVGGGGGRDR